MSQARYFDYGFTLTGDAYAFLLREAFVPGVYSGLDVSLGRTPDEIVIAPGTVLLSDGVLVSEDQQQTIKFQIASSSNGFVIAARHKYQHITGGTPAEFSVVPIDTLTAWAAGYAYYVIGSYLNGVVSSVQKIRDRLQYVLENFVASSVVESFPVPFLSSGGGSGGSSSIFSFDSGGSAANTTIGAPSEEILFEQLIRLDTGTVFSIKFDAVLAVTGGTGDYSVYIGSTTPKSTTGGVVVGTLSTTSLTEVIASVSSGPFTAPTIPGGVCFLQIVASNTDAASNVSTIRSPIVRGF